MGREPSDSLWTAAIDGGTTNTRVRLLAGDHVVAEASRAIGVGDVAAGRSAGLRDAIADGLREVLSRAGIDAPHRIVANGMLTSEMGLAPVPHVVAPAGLDELARAAEYRTVPEIGPIPILLVPGVRTPPGSEAGGWADADVLRGEECETLAWWRAEAASRPDGPTRFVWPGSHTKLVAVDGRGRIVASFTTLAGELGTAVGRHTILAASLPDPWPRDVHWPIVEEADRLVARHGLGRAAFLVRIAALDHHWTPEDRARFWAAAVAADDVARLLLHPLLADETSAIVHVGGSDPRRSLYHGLLGRSLFNRCVTRPTDHLAALGAAMVAARRAELGERPPTPG